MTNSVQIVFTALLHHNIVAIQKLFGIKKKIVLVLHCSFHLHYFSVLFCLLLCKKCSTKKHQESTIVDACYKHSVSCKYHIN